MSAIPGELKLLRSRLDASDFGRFLEQVAANSAKVVERIVKTPAQ